MHTLFFGQKENYSIYPLHLEYGTAFHSHLYQEGFFPLQDFKVSQSFIYNAQSFFKTK